MMVMMTDTTKYIEVLSSSRHITSNASQGLFHHNTRALKVAFLDTFCFGHFLLAVFIVHSAVWGTLTEGIAVAHVSLVEVTQCLDKDRGLGLGIVLG